MTKGKVIVIEGTDSSGKATQSELLLKRLNESGFKTEIISFPRYETPTGRIVGGPYLGKKRFNKCWFEEGADKLDPIVASMYYVADRVYAIKEIKQKLNNGTHLILDRYVFSNMAHQGGKVKDSEKRRKFYRFIEKLEFDMIGLPRPDVSFFLFVNEHVHKKIIQRRIEAQDEHESNRHHLKNSEKAYFELSKLYGWKVIDCGEYIDIDNPKNKENSIKQISDVLYKHVINFLSKP